MKTIIDISSHNGDVDWAKVKSHVDGAIIRLGYRGYGAGTLMEDTHFISNVRGCVTNQIPFSVYFFTTAISEAEGREEAVYVLSKIAPYKISLPIFIDSEYSNQKHNGRSDNLSKAQRTRAVGGFCSRIKEAGYIPGIYASESWFKNNLDMDYLPYAIWCAKYSSTPPSYPKDIMGWQYTDAGAVAGVKTVVDLSHWYKDFTGSQTSKPEPPKVPVDYMQTDSKWSSKKYAAPGESSTIGSAGCGIAVAAMVIASLADPGVTPVETAKWSMDHGYKALHQGTYYSYFVPQFKEYGIKCTQLNGATIYHNQNQADLINSRARKAVENGNWVIACMGPGDWTSSGHFVLWYGVSGNNALIMDSNSKKESRRNAPISKFQYQVKFYWEIEVDTMTDDRVLELVEKWFKDKQSGKVDEETARDLDWSWDHGIMKDGNYKHYATREDVALAVTKVFKLSTAIDILEKQMAELAEKPVSSSIRPYLDWVEDNKIMNDGEYNRPVTRAEVAIMMKRLYDLISK